MKKTKITVITTAFVLMLTFAATLLTLPIVSAHDPPLEITTYAYLAISPNPVGVGQTVIILYWAVGVPAGNPSTAAGIGGYRWIDLELEVTNPNGDKQTLGPYVSDPIGGGWAAFTPDQVGTYTFEVSFPEQQSSLYHPVTGVEGDASRYPDYVNDIYLPSTASTTLTVQQDPAPEAPTPQVLGAGIKLGYRWWRFFPRLGPSFTSHPSS